MPFRRIKDITSLNKTFHISAKIINSNLSRSNLNFSILTPTFSRDGFYESCFQNPSENSDGLHTRVLKVCSNEISPILALIYNESLARGDVPDEWRQANVSPVFKKDEKYDAANYRPMSLTCIYCKTLEHILVSNINKYLAYIGSVLGPVLFLIFINDLPDNIMSSVRRRLCPV